MNGLSIIGVVFILYLILYFKFIKKGKLFYGRYYTRTMLVISFVASGIFIYLYYDKGYLPYMYVAILFSINFVYYFIKISKLKRRSKVQE